MRGKMENEKEIWMEKPPTTDDCCPICFEDFKVPCQTNCRHWFCANCILTFWNYSDPLNRCKCPICSCLINTMKIEASVVSKKENDEVIEAYRKVHKYNCLFAGGALSLIAKAHHTPQYCRKFLIVLFDPSKIKRNYIAARAIALFLTVLYTICGFGDFWETKSDIDFIVLTCMAIPTTMGIVCSTVKKIFYWE